MDETPTRKAKSYPADPIEQSRWRKWARRFLLGATALFVLAVVALFGARAYFRHTGERDLKAEMARLDAEDPGWRWEDLEAARQKAAPPEAENSAAVVREVRALIPKEWREWAKRPQEPRPDPEPEPTPLNRQTPLEELAGDEELVAATRPARDRGLALRNYPRGHHVVKLPDVPFLMSLEETQGTREVAQLMRVDAVLAAQNGDAVRGLQAARAILNAGRSVGDEPTLISSLVRFALGNISAEVSMRVLAQVDAKGALSELAVLQAALFAEAEEPVLLNGLRGERATMNRFFSALNDGTIGPDQLARMGDMKPGPEHRAAAYLHKAFWPEDQRRFLRLMSDYVEAADKPYQEQLAISQRIEADVRANWDIRYPLHRLMLPASQKLVEANVRHRAEVLSAATLLACERFRLSRGRWPASLAEIPKDLLPTIPTDPFTGEPMKFARLPDGITVYSVGSKEIESLRQKRLTKPLGGTEIGWRLYDPPLRGLPPALPLAPAPHEVEQP